MRPVAAPVSSGVPYGQEATEALDGQRRALHGVGQGCDFERGILALPHLGG